MIFEKITAILKGMARRFRQMIEKTHANWYALGGLALSVLGVLVTMSFSSPSRDPSSIAVDEAAPMVNNDEPRVVTAAPELDNACSERQELMWSQMRTLVESKIKECLPLFHREIELQSSCQKDEKSYTVVIKYQVSGLANDEIVAFAATYIGEDINNPDFSKVSLIPISPMYQHLCEERKKEMR